jgi:hypothetical protein
MRMPVKHYKNVFGDWFRFPWDIYN